MKKLTSVLILLTLAGFLTSGCSGEKADTGRGVPAKIEKQVALIEKVQVTPGAALAYIPITAAKASSFDQTPDWAPEPNPMAPVDGDMLTRWSSDYSGASHWIYFDLGTESVVSNVIVRWERAYATKYQILVSSDAQSWKKVYQVDDNKGGVVEVVFSAAKCRYVKVLSLEKLEENWGISIWEVEIYGPGEHNPHATVTKKAYLSKGEDGSKKEEAKALLEELAADTVSIKEKPFQKGVVYTSWMADELASPASDFMLAYIKKTGFDTIAIMVPAYQDTLDSKKVFTNDYPGGDTPTMEALKHAVDSCHKLGLRVMIKPHVDPRTDEARINIMPSEEWFDSYEGFTLKYARFSEENNVEIFSIGTELEATTFESWTHRWNQIIDKVKEVYSGTLTYSANWTEFEEVPFWDKIDFIGIDAYFPLANSGEATPEDLVNAWEAIAERIEKWREEKGLTDKGVILTEIGYPSADGAAQQPWAAISKVEDQQEQADCLEAMFGVLSKRSWYEGYYIWQYFPQDRWSPLGFTVKDKKAEEVIKKWVKL